MSLLSKIRRQMAEDARSLKIKREAVRDPQLRSDLAKLSRVIGKRCSSVSMWGSRPSVTIDCSDLDSFKTGPLPALLSKLIDLGVDFRSSYDYPEGGNRDFSGRFGNIDVRVAAYLSSTAKACSIKKVGEETRIVPKFELCCE